MPKNTLTVPSDEPVEIISKNDPQGDYDIVVSDAPVILNDRRSDAADKEGRELERGRPAILTKNERLESVYAIADGTTDADVSVEKTRFSIIKEAPIREVQVENVSTLGTIDTVEAVDTVTNVDDVATLGSITESVDSNHYPNGAAADEDGTSYPYNVSPSETIKELGVEPGGEIAAEITTTGGDTFTVPVTGKVIFDRWDVDSVEFQDPDGTTARLIWWWAGE